MNYKKVLPILLLVLIFLGTSLYESAFARGRGGGSRGSHTSHSSHSSKISSSHQAATSSHKSYSIHTYRSPKPSATYHRSTYASTAPRDTHGRIKRSEKAKHDFQRSNPCPSTGRATGSCPGYVIDHVQPLKRGGADSQSNMQWQTKEAAKVKDKWE